MLDFIEFKGRKKNTIYKETGLSNGYFDKVKELGADKIERIISIFPDLNLEWLITGKGTMLKEMANSHSDAKYNVYDFETPAAAGAAIIMNDVDKTKASPSLYIPGMRNGTYIRVSIQGDSMHSTIKDGDKVLAILLHHPGDEIRSGYIYTVIDKEDGLVTKRLYKEGKEMVELVSDNEIYRPYKRSLNDFLAVFKVIEVHTTDLRNYFDDVRKDVRALQMQVKELERAVKR